MWTHVQALCSGKTWSRIPCTYLDIRVLHWVSTLLFPNFIFSVFRLNFFPGCKPHKHNSVQLSLSGDGDQTSAHQHTFSATSSAIGITGMSNRFISFQWYSPVGYLSVMHKREQELQRTHSCRLELNFWRWEQPNASFCAQVSDSYRVTQWFLKII